VDLAQESGPVNARWLAGIVLVLSAYLIFGALGARSLENKDISRTAEIARETLERGRWLAPTREGELETEKPPLYIWMVAALGRVTGKIGPIESRLPSALASFAGVLVVFEWMRRRRGLEAAALAAAFLASGQLFLELARFSRVDSVFAFLLTLSVLFAHAAEEERLARQLALSIASGVALGLAALAKSPLLAVVLHLGAVGAWIVVDGLLGEVPPGESRARRLVIRLLRNPASLPPLIAIVVFATWFLPFWNAISAAERLDVTKQFLFENVRRGIGDGADKPKALWFYVPRLLSQCAPSSLFALALFILNDVRASAVARATRRFASAWWIAPFAILSVARGKDARYLLPCLPGLAIAAAEVATSVTASDGRGARLFRSWVASLAWKAAALAALGLPIAAALAAPELLGDAFWLAAGAGATACFGFAVAREPETRRFLLPVFLLLFLGEAGWNVLYQPSPSYDVPRSPLRALARTLPSELRLCDLVLFQPPRPDDSDRQRRTRILLSIYREDALPLVARDPKEFMTQLAPEERRGLLRLPDFREELAPVAQGLEVEQEIRPSGEKHEEAYLLVRKRGS
jgi:4-amino-4-deoxy-L-arabinose transferase-like glycosyltransferase